MLREKKLVKTSVFETRGHLTEKEKYSKYSIGFFPHTFSDPAQTGINMEWRFEEIFQWFFKINVITFQDLFIISTLVYPLRTENIWYIGQSEDSPICLFKADYEKN